MAGIAFFLFFLAGGLTIARYWLPGLRPLTRWYAGASFGLFSMLWLPALWACVVAFTVTAHLLAVLTLCLLMMVAYLTRDPRPRVRYGEEDRRMLRAVLLVVVPLTLIAGWLEYSHSIRIAPDGTCHVGQSTYGDLSLHLAVASSAVNAAFPLKNSLMVGATMAYPYLSDTFASSFYLLGMNLSAAMAFTGTVMCASVFTGFALLCANLCRRRGAVTLAVLLLFLNGGLGFFYTLSGTTENGAIVSTAWDNLRTVMTGYYQTPTNQPDPNNLRWVNILCDMLVPQRGLLGGWTILMPVLLLIVPPLFRRDRPVPRALILAGIMAGGMPLIYTHTFLALAIASLGFCLYTVCTAPKSRRAEAFRPFLLYGAIAALLSLPQLFGFTFVQATSSDHFLRFRFNWCNNRGGNGLVDPYFWFYIKNVGLPYLLILLALLERRKGGLREEADRADALTDGLYRRKPAATTAVTPEAESIPAESVAQTEAQTGLEESMTVASAQQPSVAEESEDDEPASVLAHEMPTYGQVHHLAAVDEARPMIAARPYIRPLPPEKLHAAAFSPEDADRVGVMRAVTGEAGPEPSHRPLIEEIFHSTWHRDEAGDAEARARATTPGEPETCFADNPPARDWVRRNRLLAAGAFLILLIAELILFQPNEYDNNKLIYVWFLLCLPMAADYALEIYARLKGLGGRRVLAALTLTVFFLSAGLTVAREAVSDYQAYSAQDVAVADFVKQNTPEHSVFLTGNQHLNPVASLAGRTIVCGSDLYLYYHGFSTGERKQEVSAFYADPASNLELLQKYGVEYVYVSPSEFYNYEVDVTALNTLLTPVYQSDDGSYLIYSVPEKLREQADPGVPGTTVSPEPTRDPSQDPNSEG
ncbi:MAG TPA: hypothetical protein PKN45_07565 [Candidatus Limiplasma sp.]|nr:hypothetical protein [Candidatus Limiplasma sp.]